ncbi:hypothetical protein GQ457_18G001220 [Hibiscus cannabinus]
MTRIRPIKQSKNKTAVFIARSIRDPSCSLPNNQHNSAGWNNVIPIALAPPPIDFCTMFHSNQANQAGRNRSTCVCHFNTDEFVSHSPTWKKLIDLGEASQLAKEARDPA